MADLQIVFPATDENALTSMLRQITKAIDEARAEESGYGLGGMHGYGAEWDSETFMMHPFCWCGREACPWCRGCTCGDNTWIAEPTTESGEKCGWCKGDMRDQDKGALSPNEPPHQAAPNFWHKPSGLRVWWYKYIGRGMDVHGDGDLAVIGAECLAEIARLQPTPDYKR